MPAARPTRGDWWSAIHDAVTARDEALQMFKLGLLSLEHRGLAERLYWSTCTKVRDAARKLDEMPEELADLEGILSDTYFCNFSVFQSLPDSWAIDQLFPIMPIHRLDEQPVRKAVLADITCDSDGKIDRFVSLRDIKRTLELHPLRDGEDYFLAAFLVGAYQETLGDLHNLFGDTHVVHIRLHEEGGWWIEEIVKGDTANKVLEYMEYDVAELYPALARDCERAVRDGRMTVAESQSIKRFYENELNGYAYLEPSPNHSSPAWTMLASCWSCWDRPGAGFLRRERPRVPARPASSTGSSPAAIAATPTAPATSIGTRARRCCFSACGPSQTVVEILAHRWLVHRNHRAAGARPRQLYRRHATGGGRQCQQREQPLGVYGLAGARARAPGPRVGGGLRPAQGHHGPRWKRRHGRHLPQYP